jgi:uncharacterized protein (DUF885 family)
MNRLRLIALATCALLPHLSHAQEPKKAAEPQPPDLAALVARPGSEVRAAARHFEADRGALMRKYSIPTAPDDYARLRKFHSDWLAAIDRVDSTNLSAEGAGDLAALRKRVDSSANELDENYRRQADIASSIPFRAEIVALELARRRLDPFDPVQLAARLTDLRKTIEQTRDTVAAELAKGNTVRGVVLTKARAERAAEATTALRTLLKSWHAFYAGYDPLFTWWTTAPFKEADAALEKYAAFLKEKSSGRPIEDNTRVREPIEPRPIATGPSDVPGLKALFARPSELSTVVQRYQADFGRGSRGPGPGKPSAERQTQLKKQYEVWQSTLSQIDFDKLSHTAQIDYLLLKNTIARDRDRLNRPGESGSRPRPKAADEIVGRPIGREALLAALRFEMIPYSPEQLVEMANREYAWCESEMKQAAREMGFGDDWRKALEKVKTLHVPPGGQPKVIRDLALEAIAYLRERNFLTVPPLAEETWRMGMMTPERQRFNPFFTGGEVISVSFPTDTMSHESKLQSLRGNNVHFSRATVHHELIPGHHLQQFMVSRHQPQRGPFSTPFWTEGWAVYWEMVMYANGFPKSPEDRIGLMFWRMHRCARVTFSLGFHLGKMTPQECIDFLVDKVGHERENATAEVRRSFAGGYGPLYQAGYLVGAKQFWALRHELVGEKMTDRAFHDTILKENHMPVEMVRAALTGQKLTRDYTPGWKFLGELPEAQWPKRAGARNGQ